MLKKISNILILIGIIIYVTYYIKSFSQIVNNKIIVDNIIQSETENEYYIGYIKIESLNIKVPLVYGTSEKELNQNIVGVSNYSNKNHLILAGHAVKSVFLSLNKIKIQTAIEVMINNKKTIYYVDDILVVQEDNLNVYDNMGLTLITCVNERKRLIVHAKTA